MDVFEAIARRRSIRRFYDRTVMEETLRRILELARYYPTPANLQPLKFIATAKADSCARIFPCLKWGGYLDRYQISLANRPTAYILVLGDREISRDFAFCAGAAATELMLGAEAMGIASCCLTPVCSEPIEQTFSIDPCRMKLLCVIALGYAAQSSRVVDQTDGPRYRLDDDGNLVVPKRRLSEIVSFDV